MPHFARILFQASTNRWIMSDRWRQVRRHSAEFAELIWKHEVCLGSIQMFILLLGLDVEPDGRSHV